MHADTIFSIQNDTDFERSALHVFNHQYSHNITYQRFCNLLGVARTSINHIDDIPYLPIQFFKQEKIVSTSTSIQKIFTSSGTTGSVTSKHYVSDLAVYERSFRKAFQYFYGDVTDYIVLALLPSYLERDGSSLVYMAEKLIRDSNHPQSGFYLHDTKKLVETLRQLVAEDKKILLLGVSFALLDLVEGYNVQLNEASIIMETGGMKGRRKEMIREELHKVLKNGFGVSQIHSEYGMTELLSQAYSKNNGLFYCPPWMKISIRNPEDALTQLGVNKTGGINVIDLANINSCSFIATQDLGKIHVDGSFEIIGRFDHSDIRGCNLMAL
ncbi:acyl-protein synthetase LuxE [Aquimarina sp. MAR_2010_214]|uniref:LuxE/PaaK family acyltransferase n=1 Tax=Aquimarina sp. MAR_2010_214 TaxID=1250026 RepID=UPI000C6FD389|nr:acyl transferase [Aquimarina sp. MAR_2010_214]PKV48322.1 acyl-protein synthetase LuxE [Aquimarina sp. MAR_2010_214]